MALRRRSLMPQGNPNNTSVNMSITMDEVDEEAERRGRVQVQRRQSFAPLKPSTSSLDEVPLTTSGYSAAQLAEHYANCMKLSAENKINVKNAFNLHIIDYMAEMVRKKSSGLDNLQAASCALDASAKIYGYRVDGLHTDTIKLAGGVLESAKELGLEQPDDNAEQQGGETQKKVRKKRTNAATIEKNLNNINIANFDLEFDVDPLFKEISTQFDSSNGGRFLCSLFTRDDSCELLIDSKAVQFSADKQPVKITKNKNFTWPSTFKPQMEESLVICPPTAHFRFNGWSPDNEDSLDESYMDFQKRSQPVADLEVDEDHVFDQNAPVMDDDDDDFGGGFVGGDDGSDNDEIILDEKRDHLRAGEKIFRGVGFTDVENLKQHLSFVPSEYSYFDSGKLMLWAGPQHWKFRQTRLPSTVNIGGATVEKRPKNSSKAKEPAPYDFMKLLTNENLTETLTLDQIVKAMSVPKTSVKLSSKTMESWCEDKLLLPENLHYSGKDFGLLYHCDFHLPTRPSKQLQVDDSIADYNPENPNDVSNFCPDSQANGYDDDHEPMADDFMSQSVGGDANHSLVIAPNRVDKVDICYAKRAKKMDMKRLKALEWELISSKIETFNPTESTNGSAIEEEQPEEPTNAEKTEKVTFKSLYKNMFESKMMPPTMAENMTVHLAFVALLHLCNENSLQLKSEGLTNFQIFKL